MSHSAVGPEQTCLLLPFELGHIVIVQKVMSSTGMETKRSSLFLQIYANRFSFFSLTISGRFVINRSNGGNPEQLIIIIIIIISPWE